MAEFSLCSRSLLQSFDLRVRLKLFGRSYGWAFFLLAWVSSEITRAATTSTVLRSMVTFSSPESSGSFKSAWPLLFFAFSKSSTSPSLNSRLCRKPLIRTRWPFCTENMVPAPPG